MLYLRGKSYYNKKLGRSQGGAFLMQLGRQLCRRMYITNGPLRNKNELGKILETTKETDSLASFLAIFQEKRRHIEFQFLSPTTAFSRYDVTRNIGPEVLIVATFYQLFLGFQSDGNIEFLFYFYVARYRTTVKRLMDIFEKYF